MGAKFIFDRFAEQIDASVNEFNRLRGTPGLHCERTPYRIAVSKELPPHVTVELELDKVAGTVRMRRHKLGAVLTDVRYPVHRTNQAHLDQAGYHRLAKQALSPLIEAFE